jgi:transposase-like protein
MCRTNALEFVVIAGFVRGLSVRDVEATLAEALGPEAALSKSTVSRICGAIKDEFDAWKRRDLSDVALAYLFLDGSVRHEAPYDRVGWKDPPVARRSGPLKLGAA